MYDDVICGHSDAWWHGWLVEGFSKKGALHLGLFSVAPQDKMIISVNKAYFSHSTMTIILIVRRLMLADNVRSMLCWLKMINNLVPVLFEPLSFLHSCSFHWNVFINCLTIFWSNLHSDMLVGTLSIFTATYVGMVVWNVAMLWNVLSEFVYFVSQCFHPTIPTFARFSFRNLLWRI